MKKFYILLSIAFQTLVAAAQSPDPISTGYLNMPTSQEAFRFINAYDGRNKQVVGEPYFYDSLYRAGELKTLKGLYRSQVKFRFNQIERTVQVQLADGKELLINEKEIIYCKLYIEDKTITLVPAPLANGRKLTLVQVIYQSPRIQLLRDIRKYLYRVKSDNIDGYSSEKVFDEVRKDYRYYLRKGDTGDFTEVKLNAKSFGKVLQKHSQLKQLFKDGEKKDGLTISKLTEIMATLDKEVQ
jgi:hypothetical protein